MNPNAKSKTSSLAFAALVTTTLLFFARLGGLDSAKTLSQLLWGAFVGLIAYLIMRTGQTSRWRAVYFVTLAALFFLYFKASLLGLTGRFFFSSDAREVPYCHIAMASTFLNTVYQELLAVQSGRWLQWGPLSLGALWLVLTLVLGQAWCSWACFYGGLDEGFSRLLKKPLLNFRLAGKIRDFPAALLIFLLLISLSTTLPVFCLWVCPLKMTTAFLDGESNVRFLQTSLFIAVGSLTLVILPLLTKKRSFCGLLCPFGAWQSFFGRVNPFRVTVAADKCTACGSCVKTCPTWVLSEESMARHEVSAYCNRCGECMAECPSGAIQFTFLHHTLSPLQKGPLAELWEVRTFFLFAALLVGGAMGSVIVGSLLP